MDLGQKIQSIREGSGVSLRELAAQAGISPSMLSQIENHGANPSINTLRSIASALNIPLYRFFQEDAGPEELVVRKGRRKTIGFPGQEVQYELLTPEVGRQIEFCMMTLPSGKASVDAPEGHKGEEAAYVVSGTLSIQLGEDCIALSAGDSLRIPPLTPHCWVNHSQKDAVVVFAVSPPSF